MALESKIEAADAIPLGTALTSVVRYVYEGLDGELTYDGHGKLVTVDVPISERDWDVTDPEARYRAAVAEVGEFDDVYGRTCLQWYIDEDKNAAGLCVYRHKDSPNRPK